MREVPWVERKPSLGRPLAGEAFLGPADPSQSHWASSAAAGGLAGAAGLEVAGMATHSDFGTWPAA